MKGDHFSSEGDRRRLHLERRRGGRGDADRQVGGDLVAGYGHAGTSTNGTSSTILVRGAGVQVEAHVVLGDVVELAEHEEVVEGEGRGLQVHLEATDGLGLVLEHQDQGSAARAGGCEGGDGCSRVEELVEGRAGGGAHREALGELQCRGEWCGDGTALQLHGIGSVART